MCIPDALGRHLIFQLPVVHQVSTGLAVRVHGSRRTRVSGPVLRPADCQSAGLESLALSVRWEVLGTSKTGLAAAPQIHRRAYLRCLRLSLTIQRHHKRYTVSVSAFAKYHPQSYTDSSYG